MGRTGRGIIFNRKRDKMGNYRKIQYILDEYGNAIRERPAAEALAELEESSMKSAADAARLRMLRRQQNNVRPEERENER